MATIPIIKLFVHLFNRKNENDTRAEMSKDYHKEGILVQIEEEEIVVRRVPFSGLKQLLTLTDAETAEFIVKSSKPVRIAIYYDEKGTYVMRKL